VSDAAGDALHHIRLVPERAAISQTSHVAAVRLAPKLMTTSRSIKTLSDRELLAEVERLVAGERQATARVVASLSELDARRLYLGEGCSCLFTYCTQVLNLSEHAAYNRIEAARSARRFPLILKRLADGSIHLTYEAEGYFGGTLFVRESSHASAWGLVPARNKFEGIHLPLMGHHVVLTSGPSRSPECRTASRSFGAWPQLEQMADR
jgi:hypothetical protein